MKIRTTIELIELLDSDLAWRKLELSILLQNVQKANHNTVNTALRTAAVLLYAHWEGWIKNAASNYLIFVRDRRLNIDDLADCFAAISLKQRLHEFDHTNKATVYTQLISFIRNNTGLPSQINETGVIRSESNLSSVVLKEIVTAIGLDFSKFELKSNLIDTQLLFYRNNIAHGQNLTFSVPIYQNVHKEVFQMIMELNNDIQNAAVQSLYRRLP